MSTIIQKFGGTSVDSLIDGRKTDLVDVANAERERGTQTIVVLSAFSKVTNALLEVIRRIQTLLDSGQSASAECNCDAEIHAVQEIFRGRLARLKLPDDRRTELIAEVDALAEERVGGVFNAIGFLSRGNRDYIVPSKQLIESSLIDIGESVSIRAAHARAQLAGIPSRYLDLHDSNAHTPEELRDNIRRSLAGIRSEELLFLSGYPVPQWDRGYSDPTAAIVAETAGAEALEIWKDDTDGIRSSDPSKIKGETSFVPHLSYREAGELCDRGKMKAINAYAVPIVQRAGIPVRVRYTKDPGHEGTLIDGDVDGQTGVVKCVIGREDVPVITVQSPEMGGTRGYAQGVLDIIAKKGYNVLCLGDDMNSLTVAVDKGRSEITPEQLVQCLRDERQGNGITVQRRALITCVGAGSTTTRNMGRAYMALAAAGVNHAVSSHSEVGMSVAFIVEKDKYADALNALHNALIRERVGEAKAMEL